MASLAQTAARSRPQRLLWLKPGVFLGALVPLCLLVRDAASGVLGADPIAIALNRLGLLALIFLVGSLAATPLQRVLGWTWPLRLRRMLGLFAFFYASLHLLAYAALDQRFDLRAIAQDIVKRPFITAGFSALVLLVPLAITSTHAMRKRLGALRWARLHSLVYVIAPLAALHFYFRVKRDATEPLVYAALIALLLLVRALTRKKREPAR